MNQQIKDILTEWLYEIYKAKGFDNIAERDAAAFNIWEAEVKAQWETLETQIGFLDAMTIEEYEEEIDSLEEQVGELASRNEELADEVCGLTQILKNVNEALNQTWN